MLMILTAIWEAAGYPWSVRLKALLPEWLPWIRKRYGLTPPLEEQLLRISARQIDRRLQGEKQTWRRRIYGRTKPGSLLKHHIPVKTDSWDVQTPGFAEIDLVPFGELWSGGICPVAKPDRYPHGLDGNSRLAGPQPSGSAAGTGRDGGGIAVSLARAGFRQQVGIY